MQASAGERYVQLRRGGHFIRVTLAEATDECINYFWPRGWSGMSLDMLEREDGKRMDAGVGSRGGDESRRWGGRRDSKELERCPGAVLRNFKSPRTRTARLAS